MQGCATRQKSKTPRAKPARGAPKFISMTNIWATRPFHANGRLKPVVRALRQSALRNMADYLRNYNDASHGMNFIPLSMKRILHKSPDNADVRTHGRQGNPVCVALTGCLSIRLLYRKSVLLKMMPTVNPDLSPCNALLCHMSAGMPSTTQ
jgi:hypothetical protein